MKFIFCTVVLLALASCSSSPRAEGESLANEECASWNKYASDLTTVYNRFISDFSSNDFKTRTNAREDLNTRLGQVEDQLQSRIEDLNNKYSSLLEKYGSDHEKLGMLTQAYNDIIAGYSIDTTNVAGLRAQANNKILTIIPPEPGISKLQDNLVGRKIRALPGGYLSNYWTWTIENGHIKDLSIDSVINVDKNHKEYVITFTLQDDGAAYRTTGKVYYVLDNRDDWEIDMLEPCDIEIVRTGRYDSSITHQFCQHIFGESINFYNNSDAALLVGFRTLDSYGKWEKHSIMIRGGENKSYSSINLKDYTIDFVERP